MISKSNLHLVKKRNISFKLIKLLYSTCFFVNLTYYIINYTTKNHFVKKIRFYNLSLLLRDKHFITQYNNLIKLFLLLTFNQKFYTFQSHLTKKTKNLSFTKSPFVHKKSYNQYYISNYWSQLHFVSCYNKILTNFIFLLIKNKLQCFFNKDLIIKLIN